MCAELVDSVELLLEMRAVDAKPMAITEDRVSRARALLAQPVAEGPTDEELLRVAATAIDPYESSGIALGEYEPETECAVEVYGSELIAYARAVLAKWGHQ
jgi:predicted phage tail protein